MNFMVVGKRIAATFVLAFVIAVFLGLLDDSLIPLSFIVLWPSLFFGWQYLSRWLGFDPLKGPAQRKPRPRPTSAKQLVVTGVLAVVLAAALAWITYADVVIFSFFPFWIALYHLWPFLGWRLPFFDFEKSSVSPAPQRPLWLRMIRGTLAWAGGIAFGLVCWSSMVIVPIALCYHRAQRVHDSIHVGMTVQQVLDTARETDIFQAGSDFPYDAKADGDNIPAMSLNWKKDGSYGTYDLAARRYVSLTESEAIERLHTKLHDGYKWSFCYTYVNMTPMHISFHVVFGPDGRVEKVTPVHGWD